MNFEVVCKQLASLIKIFFLGEIDPFKIRSRELSVLLDYRSGRIVELSSSFFDFTYEFPIRLNIKVISHPVNENIFLFEQEGKIKVDNKDITGVFDGVHRLSVINNFQFDFDRLPINTYHSLIDFLWFLSSIKDLKEDILDLHIGIRRLLFEDGFSLYVHGGLTPIDPVLGFKCLIYKKKLYDQEYFDYESAIKILSAASARKFVESI